MAALPVFFNLKLLKAVVVFSTSIRAKFTVKGDTVSLPNDGLIFTEATCGWLTEGEQNK